LDVYLTMNLWRSGMVIKGLDETHIQVTDLDESIKFYELLGLKLLNRSRNRVAFMMVGHKVKQEIGSLINFTFLSFSKFSQ
jgi:catechol 2,3-dioxygenase-like lactoylglutathione lyase family enzyme